MSPATTNRAILHVDMDAFYASIEQRDDPSLKGKPVIVGGTSGRGVVAAASYEVRKFGVHSAMPMTHALRLCPHAICVKPRMQHYRRRLGQVFAIFHEFTPVVQGLSLDEAFLDVTDEPRRSWATRSRSRAPSRTASRPTTQLTASVGVAPNKLVAKIASDLKKPDGLTVVTPQKRSATALDPLSVRRLPGLGPQDRREGRGAGHPHARASCAARSDAVLWPIFGRYTQRVRERASGIDDRPVICGRRRQSISAEDTFEHGHRRSRRLQTELTRLADRHLHRAAEEGAWSRAASA